MKPIVHYEGNSSGQVVGNVTWVIVQDHPRHKPGTLVRTSTVVAIHEDGFETLNTIYKRGETTKTTE